MRCPSCKLVVSDKKDLCPSCTFDLRPEKKRLGLAINDPHLPYETLAQKKKSASQKRPPNGTPERKKRKKKKKKEEEKRGIFGALFALFRGNTTAKPEKPEKKRKVSTAPLEQAPQPVEPPSEPITLEPAPIVASPPEETLSNNHDSPSQWAERSEESPAAPLSIDELAFESLFDGGEELLEELGAPPEIPDEVKAQEELVTQLKQSIEENLEETKEITEALRALSAPTVAPEVMEFTEEDDELFEQQLDELLGDEILEVEAVKQQKPLAPEPAKTALIEDDLEISFEFEVEDSSAGDLQLAAAESSLPTSVAIDDEFQDPPLEMLRSLEDALSSLESELESHSISEVSDTPGDDAILSALEGSLENTAKDAPPVKSELPEPPKFDRALQERPTELNQLLLSHLAKIYGCTAEEFFSIPAPSDEPSLQALERELDAEWDALTAEGFTLQSDEFDPVAEESAAETPPLDPWSEESPQVENPTEEWSARDILPEEPTAAEQSWNTDAWSVEEDFPEELLEAPSESSASLQEQTPDETPPSASAEEPMAVELSWSGGGWSVDEDRSEQPLEATPESSASLPELHQTRDETPSTDSAEEPTVAEQPWNADAIKEFEFSDSQLIETGSSPLDTEEFSIEFSEEESSPVEASEEALPLETIPPREESLSPVEQRSMETPSDPWLWAEEELSTGAEEQFDLDVVKLFRDAEHEKALVLFDTAYEALSNEQIENSFNTDLWISVDRIVENDGVEQIFEEYGEAAYVEHVEEEKRAAEGYVEEEAEFIWIQPLNAPLWRRPIAFGIDLVVSLAIATAYLWFGVLTNAERSYLTNEGEYVLILAPIAWKFLTVWSLSFLGQAVLISGRGFTIGQGVMGMKVFQWNAEHPTLSTAMLRMCAVVTEAMFGFFGSLLALGRGRRSLADRLSGTGVTPILRAE